MADWVPTVETTVHGVAGRSAFVEFRKRTAQWLREKDAQVQAAREPHQAALTPRPVMPESLMHGGIQRRKVRLWWRLLWGLFWAMSAIGRPYKIFPVLIAVVPLAAWIWYRPLAHVQAKRRERAFRRQFASWQTHNAVPLDALAAIERDPVSAMPGVTWDQLLDWNSPASRRLPGDLRTWLWGAMAEVKTGHALASLSGLFVFHDLAIEGSEANVDHVVVAPTGVFVVDSKAWTGTITLASDGLTILTDGVPLARNLGGKDPLKSFLWEREKVAEACGFNITQLQALVVVHGNLAKTLQRKDGVLIAPPSALAEILCDSPVPARNDVAERILGAMSFA